MRSIDVPQQSKRWFELHVGRITGSNLAGYLGMSRFKTHDDVLESIRSVPEIKLEYHTEGIWKGRPIIAKKDILMANGVVREQTALRTLKHVFPGEIKQTGIVIADEYPRLAVSPDGIGYNSKPTHVIEIKSTYNSQSYRCVRDLGKKIKMAESIFPEHYVQIHLSMFLVGVKECIYIVYDYIKGEQFTFTVPFDKEYWDKIMLLFSIRKHELESIPFLISPDEV